MRGLTLGEIFAHLFSIGVDVIATTYDAATKTITAQLGDVVKGRADSDGAELWFGAPGLWSRPANPTQGSAACQTLAIRRGDHDRVFAYRDLRCSSIYGALDAGETCVGATVGQARTVWKKDGSITRVVTSDNTANGTTITDRLGPDGWTITTPWGQISITSAGLTISIEGGGSIAITPEGIGKFIATQVAVQGSLATISGDVATVLGPRATPTSASGCAYSSVGPVNAVSTNVFVSV